MIQLLSAENTTSLRHTPEFRILFYNMIALMVVKPKGIEGVSIKGDLIFNKINFKILKQKEFPHDPLRMLFLLCSQNRCPLILTPWNKGAEQKYPSFEKLEGPKAAELSKKEKRTWAEEELLAFDTIADRENLKEPVSTVRELLIFVLHKFFNN